MKIPIYIRIELLKTGTEMKDPVYVRTDISKMFMNSEV